MLRIISHKAKNEMDAKQLIDDKFRELVLAEQKKVEISFDLENNECVDDRKIVTDQTYIVQMFSAAGDWQQPVQYFRIQVDDGSPHKHMFVFIPDKEQGNTSLVESKKGGYVAAADARYKADNIKNDKEKCWKSVKEYLKTWWTNKAAEY